MHVSAVLTGCLSMQASVSSYRIASIHLRAKQPYLYPYNPDFEYKPDACRPAVICGRCLHVFQVHTGGPSSATSLSVQVCASISVSIPWVARTWKNDAREGSWIDSNRRLVTDSQISNTNAEGWTKAMAFWIGLLLNRSQIYFNLFLASS